MFPEAEDRRSNGSVRCYLPFARTTVPAHGRYTQQDKGGVAVHASAIQLIGVTAPSKVTEQSKILQKLGE